MTREMQAIRAKSLEARKVDRREAEKVQKTLEKKWFERLGRKA